MAFGPGVQSMGGKARIAKLSAREIEFRSALEQITRLPTSFPNAADAANTAIEIARKALEKEPQRAA